MIAITSVLPIIEYVDYIYFHLTSYILATGQMIKYELHFAIINSTNINIIKHNG